MVRKFEADFSSHLNSKGMSNEWLDCNLIYPECERDFALKVGHKKPDFRIVTYKVIGFLGVVICYLGDLSRGFWAMPLFPLKD